LGTEPATKIGIIGTGFIGNGLLKALEYFHDLDVSCVLTRRDLGQFAHTSLYTNSIQELIDKSQLVVECAGDTLYSTDAISRVMEAGLPVLTMNAELHVTCGTYLSQKGLLTEAEGDQPGTLAALHEDAVAMGFKPLVYGNLKGFLNHDPKLEDMQHWAKMQGISLTQVTGFTDGTKLQIEQVLVANGIGARIIQQGMLGFEADEVQEGSLLLAERAKAFGHPISDYLLSSPNTKRKLPAGVFIVAEHDPRQKDALKYLKMGEGPFYTLLRNYHLCHLEIPKTIRRILQGGGVLLDNSSHPTSSVAAIAKVPLKPGMKIERGVGGFHARGEAVEIRALPNHLPIGLMSNTVITKAVEPGQMVSMDDVELQDSLALKAWQLTRVRAMSA
jgi:predicted homoserine dehydrogenase-like protein